MEEISTDIGPDKEGKVEIAPLRTPEVRAIIRKAKNEWGGQKDIRGTITTRDILEFAAVRNMASALQEASIALSNIQNNGGYTREKVEKKFEEIMNNPERQLSQRQKEALKRGKDTILDSIDTLDNWRRNHGNEDLHPLLGERLSKVDHSHLKLDLNSFPGAVVVEITDPESYQAVRGKESSLGFYNETVGKGILKGRVLVINTAEARESTAEHEYQHFLFAQVIETVDFIPEVSERKVREEESELENMYTQRKERLAREKTETEFDSEQEFDELGYVTSQTSKQLMTATRQLEALPRKLDRSKLSRSIHRGTYPNGPVLNTFIQFRNEFVAYANAGQFAPVAKHFKDTEKDTEKDPYSPTFQAETELFLGILAYVKKSGVEPERLGLLIGSSRNMRQAAKFAFLETQMSHV